MQKKGDATERRCSIVKCGKMPFRGGVACESHVGFCMYEIHLETTEFICVNVGVRLVGSCQKAAKVYSHYI